MTKKSDWNKIPFRLRLQRNWCYTDPNRTNPKERKAPLKATGALASPVQPSDWMSFEEACQHAERVGGEIGHILQEGGGLTCIDLDVKDFTNYPDRPDEWTTKEDYDRYWKICEAFGSYTEISCGGKGLHIWVEGEIGKGCRRDGIEVYSQERFIICTGKPVVQKPVANRQSLLNQMVADIKQHEAARQISLEEYEEQHTDKEIYERASRAFNKDKFHALCKATSCVIEGGVKKHGSYRALGYESQSEADLALLSIFAFYSNSNEQCRRLFRMSGLGQREKARESDRYIDETLKRIRGRQELEASVMVDLSHIAATADKVLRRGTVPLHAPVGTEPVEAPAPAAAILATLGPLTPPLPMAPLQGNAPVAAPAGGLAWPPGLVGQIARYVYNGAPRPVKEVAIVTAIGIMAGICGKAFCIPKSGLNMYIILVARSAVGKEAMHSGVAELMTAVSQRQPAAFNFVDFTEYVSGPALKKAVAANPSFLNVCGEWGRRLMRMSEEKDGAAASLRTVMTDLYQKSGPQSVVGGLGYSDRDNNSATISGVAYSMVGESTPQRFYSSLTEGMMEDGFLSRFLIIDYEGDRPALNKNPETEPPKVLADAVADLCTYAGTLISKGQTVQTDRTEEVALIFEAFEVECDNEINRTKDEMWRQMWNRAALKAMRLSALLAIGDNWITPVIKVNHAEWAIEVIRNDIRVMSGRIASGDVGTDEMTRIKKFVSVVKNYLEYTDSFPEHGYDKMKADGIIPRAYLQMNLLRSTPFASSKMGATAAMDACTKSLCENGVLYELDRSKLAVDYGFRGRAFKILNLSDTIRGIHETIR